MVLPVLHQIVLFVVGTDGAINIGAAPSGADRVHCHLLRCLHMLEHGALPIRWPTNDHRPLQFGVVSPHRCARTADEDIALMDNDVAGEGMRHRSVASDSAISGEGSGEEGALGA